MGKLLFVVIVVNGHHRNIEKSNHCKHHAHLFQNFKIRVDTISKSEERVLQYLLVSLRKLKLKLFK